jgi:hypothetical protein
MPDQNESNVKAVEDAKRTFLTAAGRLTFENEPAVIYHVQPHALADDDSTGDDE